MKKKICFVITSRAQYARVRHLLYSLNSDPFFELHIIVACSALLHKYGGIGDELTSNGFQNVEMLYTNIEGGNNISMAKTTGLSILEFSNAIQRFNPDVLVVIGDRYEVLAAAVAGAYLNKTIAHIEGGDLSGTIDESVRHAVTKLAHLHFTTNELSRRRVIQMGENSKYVYNIGSLDIEYLRSLPAISDLSFVNKYGAGAIIDYQKKFLTVVQHPVTTGEDNYANLNETLKAVHALKLPAIWFWPNADAGEESTAKALRQYREQVVDSHIRFIIHMPPQEFLAILKKSSCLIGNSSAGIKESSYLGLPVVNIGTRQQGRLAAKNIINTNYQAVNIARAITYQLRHGSYSPSNLYHQPGTSAKIISILKNAAPPQQKEFFSI